MVKNFVLIGSAGYIAPRHMEAILKTENNLIASYDPYDGVGILDKYFPDSSFFTEFERFDRYLDKLKRNSNIKIDYFSICSPNYLHDSHVRYGLNYGSNIICEKPLVLSPWNIDELEKIEKDVKGKVFNVLQLRYHSSIKKLKKDVTNELNINKNKIYNIELDYITSRGKWYDYSWKGDIDKSGGLVTNIGIHFFDMLIWIFGDVKSFDVNKNQPDFISGILNLKNANIKWKLSSNPEFLPENIKKSSLKTYRNIKIDNEDLEFSKGFTDLHTITYKEILNGNGFGLEDARPSIELVSKLR